MSGSSRSLSIDEWVKLAKQDINIPVRIQLNGFSMEPLIRKNEDYVTIVPLKRNPVIGDIVLFSDEKNQRFVVHRVWEIRDNMIRTWGDNCYNPDRWMSVDSLIGLVTKLEKANEVILLDNAEERIKGIKRAKMQHAKLNFRGRINSKLKAVKKILKI